MKQLVISSSLSENSRSRVLAEAAAAALWDQGETVQYLDLAELAPELSGSQESWSQPAAARLRAAIEDADGVVLALGIYNYGPSAAAKTVLELGGKAFNDKPVSLLVAAGGPNSYMAVMPLLTGLMLDFRSLINPRFVYASGAELDSAGIKHPEIETRVRELAASQARLTRALAPAMSGS